MRITTAANGCSRRAKVLHLITHMGVGGALDNTLLTVERLNRDRYEVHLATGQLEERDGYSDWEDRGRAGADAFLVIPGLCRPVRPWQDLLALRRLIRLIRREGYDVVHTHCAKAGILGRLAARLAGVPVIVHTWHLFGWQAVREPTSRLTGGFAALEKWVYVSAERWAASLSDALITVSSRNLQEAVDRKIAPAERIRTIYSGIDLAQFQPKTRREETCRGLGLDPRKPIVGTIGRLSAQKAPLDFVRAAKDVLRSRPDVQFVMAGDGPLSPEVQQAIGNETRIRLLGFCEEVPALLSVMDIFVLSSLWEGLGRAMTEAMAMGLPVAVTAVDGVPELVEHGRTGLLSPPGSPEALAANVVSLLDDPEQARRLGRRARDRVVPEFSAEHMVQEIDVLYQQLLGARSGTVEVAHRPAAESHRNPIVLRPVKKRTECRRANTNREVLRQVEFIKEGPK